MYQIYLLRGLSLLVCCAGLQLLSGARAQAHGQPTSAPLPVPAAGAAPKAQATDAEKIANTRDSIKQAAAALEKIQKRLADPDSEYAKAETEFEALNGKLKAAKAAATKFRKDQKEAEAVALEATLPGLQEDWQLAKDRFDIAIRQRKVTQETIDDLKRRIESDMQLLDRLEGKTQQHPNTSLPVNPPKAPPTSAAVKPLDPGSAVPSKADPKTATDASPAITLPGMPGLPGPPATATGDTVSAPVGQSSAPNDNDPIVRQASELLSTRRNELREVEARVRVADERVRIMERTVRNVEKALGLEQEAVAQTEKAVTKLAGAKVPEDPVERAAHTRKWTEAVARTTESRERIQRITDRLGSLNESLDGLRAERDVVAQEAGLKQQQVNEAEADLNALLNPASTRNLFRWVLAKGPHVLLVIVGMFVAHLASRQFSHHVVRFITRNSHRGSPEDRENRASTLVGVFRYAVGLVVFGGGGVMILDEIGVPIVPLMGGAAVLGLAVAFGAQNLIRDYFTGFMMLMEDQYSVNDVVKIGAIAGLVELITLRMTVLRDLEGVRHFIPHGTVTSVSNLTHGWSRAMIDVPVAHKENVDRVIDVLKQLGQEMRLDPVLGEHILEDAEMLGVDGLSDSGVVVRFLLKTRPLKQWPVKREMLRRIKNRFDELGIEIPFPRRTLYHRFPEGTAGASAFVGEAERNAA